MLVRSRLPEEATGTRMDRAGGSAARAPPNRAGARPGPRRERIRRSPSPPRPAAGPGRRTAPRVAGRGFVRRGRGSRGSPRCGSTPGHRHRPGRGARSSGGAHRKADKRGRGGNRSRGPRPDRRDRRRRSAGRVRVKGCRSRRYGPGARAYRRRSARVARNGRRWCAATRTAAPNRHRRDRPGPRPGRPGP